jgi:predicted kinase
MSRLILMCGIPGSGKTALVKQFKPPMAIHISRDEIRFNLLKDDDKYFAKENQVFRTFINEIDKYINMGCTVYADATHLTRKARAKTLHALRSHPDAIQIIYCKTSLLDCLERNDLREGRARVPDSTIRQMYNDFEEPRLDEGFDCIWTVEDEQVVDVKRKER